MTFPHPHQRNDWIALEMARRIAARIEEDPAILGRALDWMAGLRAAGRDFAAHREWQEILKTKPASEVARLLVVENDNGQRLRSSHPFKGVIPESERLAIIEDAFAG